MPLDTRTYDLADVADSLHERMAEKASAQADYDRGTDGAAQAAEEGQRYQQFRAGMLWALGFPDRDSDMGANWNTDSVTLASLTAGDRQLITDIHRDEEMPRSNLYVAVGTVDAPYVKHDPDAITRDGLVETAVAIADIHPHFSDWAETEISELSGMGAEGNAYRKLVQEKRTSTT